ncbi:MAG: hypothetical protein ABIJ14_00130 [Nanoarchaeota archaeon]
MHELIKTLRINLAEGDTEEMCFNSLDFRIISQYLSTEDELQDEYLDAEKDIFLNKYHEFLMGLRENLLSSNAKYNQHKQDSDFKGMQETKQELQELRGYFSNLLDPSTQEFVSELDSTINEMENP